MRVTVLLGLALLVSAAAIGEEEPKSLAPDDAEFAARINRSIDRGVAWLAAQRGADGLYAGKYGPSGISALAVYALAVSGVRAEDPRVAPAVAALRELPVTRGTIEGVYRGRPAIRMTYDHAMLVLALVALDPQAFRREIRRSVRILAHGQLTSGQWAYRVPMGLPWDHGDNSNTQMALLALRSAALAGFRVPGAVWRRAHAHFRGTIRDGGGWGYGNYGMMRGTYGSMTAAALSSLVLARSMMLDDDELAGYDFLAEPAARRGMIWMEDHFDVERHPGMTEIRTAPTPLAPNAGDRPALLPELTYQYYWLYSIERLGMLLLRRYVGDHDWYREGADWLLEAQSEDGAWRNPVPGAGSLEPPVVATSFALLFLQRATVPAITPRVRGR